jgi:AcrR family transcriptional regulator
MKADTTQKKRAFHHGDLRAQLILAVRKLVETKGADGFSIAEAARAAGVSSGAPYKHFADRPDLLRSVAADGMERLREAMQVAVEKHPPASLEGIVAIGLAYVAFAKAQPGVFRLMFGLTDGHEKSPELSEVGQRTFGVVLSATADHVGESVASTAVQETAYLLWTHVHGHAFLTIDSKRRADETRPDDHYYVSRACKAILQSHEADGV